MKLKHLSIENFKGVKKLDIDLTSPGSPIPRFLTCLTGDNGAGKTTVLQAIALTLSLATRRTRELTRFNWHGFLPERISSLGPARVELEVIFEDDEIRLNRELFREWYESRPADWLQNHPGVVEPEEHKQVTLVYSRGRVESPQGRGAVNQFLGRYHLLWLRKAQPEKNKLFPRLGDVFWFDQHRNLGSVVPGQGLESTGKGKPVESWQAGVEQLREFLVGWWGYHTSPSKGAGKDFILLLEQSFARLFPGTQFRGIMPREQTQTPSAKDFYFLLERDGRVFDLAEMSSGQQAIFPLLYEFIRLDIARSIVLIDELELHLHPPEQQALLGALRHLGEDCQFLITTHSPFLTEVIPRDRQVRLQGGRACL